LLHWVNVGNQIPKKRRQAIQNVRRLAKHHTGVSAAMVNEFDAMGKGEQVAYHRGLAEGWRSGYLMNKSETI
jgi:hypothetical protein